MDQNVHLLKKLPRGTEAANILMGRLENLSTPLVAFIRLKEARSMENLPEVAVPTRFFFIILSPADHSKEEILAVARTSGILFADSVFSRVAANAENVSDICDGIEEYISHVTVIPPGYWERQTRMEPAPNVILSRRRVNDSLYPEPSRLVERRISRVETEPAAELRRTGRLFGGFVEDCKRKWRWYISDFTDAFRVHNLPQILAAVLFLFIADLANIVTFGGVMGGLLDEEMATVENIMSAALCGIIYALFSGQPLAILSAEGPILVFEVILHNYCKDYNLAFLPTRFWVGAWMSIFLLLQVAFDVNSFVAYITKFTEEAFATLISVVFVIKTAEELVHLEDAYEVVTDVKSVLADGPCKCNISRGAMQYQFTNLTGKECSDEGGVWKGLQCDFHPDIFMFSVILCAATFIITFGLKKFRKSGFFPNKVRQLIAQFNVFIAVVMMTAVSALTGLKVPDLPMPSSLRPTRPDRSWFVNPLAIDYWWLSLVAIVPAIFMCILVVMDQQTTVVILNRKENKLKKGYGYHLDLLVLAALTLICSFMGIPFFAAATVISIVHVDSLKLTSAVSAPGEKPQFLGITEQRVTALLTHILVGLSVVFTPVITLVPVPVILGVFLYMGFVSLQGQSFVYRVLLFFRPQKYQPDFRFLRLVPLSRVHLFTVIQLISVAILCACKYTEAIALLFPLMLIVMMFIRKGMDYVFTQRELWALDDILPHWRLLFCPPQPGEDAEENESEPEREHLGLNGIARTSNEIDEIEEVNEDEEHVNQISFVVPPKDRETTI